LGKAKGKVINNPKSRSKRFKGWFTRKKIVAITFIALFGIFFYIALYKVPDDWYYNAPILHVNEEIGQNSTLTNTTTGMKVSFTFYAILDFKTNGSFSVDNPVLSNITIWDVRFLKNNSAFVNFSSYFCCAGFPGAFPIGKQSYQPVIGRELNAVFNLTRGANFTGTPKGINNYTYVATGSFIFDNPVTVFVFLFNSPKQNVLPLHQLETGPQVLSIAPFSETLAINNTRNTIKLQWVLSTFSILLIEPIFQNILAVKQSGQKNTEDE